ncbi:unnamed protein product, partial [marine sediment metagenome]
MLENEIRVAIAGVGTIASGIVQGIAYFKEYQDKRKN